MRKFRSAALSILSFLFIATTAVVFQNCASFKAISNGSIAGSSYCVTQPGDTVCRSVSLATCSFNGQTLATGQSVTAFLNGGGTCTSQTRVCQTGSLSGSYSYASCSPSGDNACLFNGLTIASGKNVTAYVSPTAADCSAATQNQSRTCTNGVLSGSFTYASCSTSGAASCLFNGQTIAHGGTVIGYVSSSVGAGQQCQSNVRTCYNGLLSGQGDFASCNIAQAASCLFNGQTIASGSGVTAYTEAASASCTPVHRNCTNGVLDGSGNYATCTPQAQASCTVGGQTVASGSTITLYTSASAPPGGTCQAEVRSCANGNLSGSAVATGCVVQTSASLASFSMNGGDQQTAGDLTLAMQTDGNLVLYRSGTAMWNSQTAGRSCASGCVMQFQTDGNIALFQGGQPYWTSKTTGLSGSKLVLSEFAPYLSVQSTDGRTRWGGSTGLTWMAALNRLRLFDGAVDFQKLFLIPNFGPTPFRT